MANKHRGEVSIKLDKMRKLKYNMHALAELEDALGYSISKMNTEDMGIRTIIKMFWAAMLHELPELTLKEAADLMDHSSLSEVSEKISEAMELSLNAPSDDGKKKN